MKISFNRLMPAMLCLAANTLPLARAGGEKPETVRCVLKLDPEIDCPSCEDRLKQIVETSRGVQSASVDVLTNRIAVRYDPARINVTALIGRIAVTGYTASEVK